MGQPITLVAVLVLVPLAIASIADAQAPASPNADDVPVVAPGGHPSNDDLRGPIPTYQLSRPRTNGGQHEIIAGVSTLSGGAIFGAFAVVAAVEGCSPTAFCTSDTQSALVALFGTISAIAILVGLVLLCVGIVDANQPIQLTGGPGALGLGLRVTL